MRVVHAHHPSCGCQHRRGWPSNVAQRRITIPGVPALVAGVIGALDAAQSHGMAGRSGTIRTGDSSDPAYRYAGYVAYQRSAALRPGASATLRNSPLTALPATSGDVRYLSPAGRTVMDHLRQLTPAGAR